MKLLAKVQRFSGMRGMCYRWMLIIETCGSVPRKNSFEE